MQYAQQGHSPANTTNQDAELRHQVRRLSHHPSIVMWDGCNECHVVMGTRLGWLVVYHSGNLKFSELLVRVRANTGREFSR